MSKLIVNVETGKTIERELNAEEIAQQEIDESAYTARQAEAEAAQAAEESAKQQAFNDAVATAVAAALAAQQP
jgi:hypothetical protein